jgi:hypothetical protein
MCKNTALQPILLLLDHLKLLRLKACTCKQQESAPGIKDAPLCAADSKARSAPRNRLAHKREISKRIFKVNKEKCAVC